MDTMKTERILTTPRFTCYIEDLEVISIEVEADHEDEAHDIAQALCEEHSFDYQTLMQKYNGLQQDGSFEIEVYEINKSNIPGWFGLPDKWTERMHLEDLDD